MGLEESTLKHLKKEVKNTGGINSHSDRLAFTEHLSKTHSKDLLKFYIADLKSIPNTWSFIATSTNSIITLFITITFGIFAVALGYYYTLNLEVLKLGKQTESDTLLSTLIRGIGIVAFVLVFFTVMVSEKIKQATFYLSICEVALENDINSNENIGNIQTVEETNIA
ncbi:hypothetical protein [Planococcus halotolerans]|uniref:Uncharacterized protein n=1 Tax=Planococcus halotolerans TaxID=2233542 RepID=A0A365KKE9_9BACL|nr:hypothetical protein [Planococcus halotolerans]RAZ73613.1 hypothetical protein DP120_16895 [Planococcus halotolerans]